MVDLLKEYPELKQDIQEHDRQRLEEYLEELDEMEATTDDEDTLREIDEVRSKIRSVRGKLDMLEQVSLNSKNGE